MNKVIEKVQRKLDFFNAIGWFSARFRESGNILLKFQRKIYENVIEDLFLQKIIFHESGRYLRKRTSIPNR
jgi:hypothetical protein